ncbi:hypothetical protein ACS0TY_020227 [Phlomoides rotata]
MAPRKKASTGGKKSSHLNREQLQPSQPPKFGIQHFFERHSQSQKAISQNSSKNGDFLGNPVSDSASDTHQKPQIVPKPVVNRKPGNELDVGADNRGGKTNLGKIESMSKYLRGENPRNDGLISSRSDGVSSNDVPVVNSVDVDCVCSGKGFNDGVVEPNRTKKGKDVLEVVASGSSKNGGMDNTLPVVIDVEDNQLEVSPEPSKCLSVKRFKFSPGMVQTSPSTSGKLEKWLSSPLRPHKKSLICSDKPASRKINRDCDLNYHGNLRNVNSSNKSEVLNTQSPFTTPPSLSCCHDKVLGDVDFSGFPDHLGSRQHKKALIELLDKVEDVISVESSVFKDEETHKDAGRCPKAELVLNHLLRKSEENRSSIDSNFNFLVLEVSEEHGPAQSPFKVLRLLNEQSGAEQALQLWDEWYFSVVAPGDTVHVIGEFDPQGNCDVNREKNFLIVHPDILVSGTRVSTSFACPRRTILDERIKNTEHSSAALMGTLLHQIFQAGLMSEFPTREFLEEYARTVLQKSLESLYACGVNENDIHKALIEKIPKLLNWISSFRDSQGSKSPSIEFKGDEGLKKIQISEVIDIEEMAWAPKYGLKGMIDASVRVRTNINAADSSEMIMPLEFKTGKGTSGQTAMEHSAQVMLYTLLMSERYMKNIKYGLLYYLHTDQTQGISVRRSDLIGLIMRRNELANDLLKASTTQQLPPMLQSPNICRSCRHLSACSIYHKAYGGTAEGSGLGDMYESLVSHLTTTQAVFLQKWERLIDLEAKHLETAKKQSWCSDISRNSHHPTCLSSLVLDISDKLSETKLFGNRHVYRFVRQVDSKQPNGNSSSSSSPLEHIFKNGDYVILSTEPDHLRVANGIVVEIGNSHISVSFTKRLRLPHNPGSMVEDLHQQSWRIEKDEIMSSFAIMRYNLIQLFLHNESSCRLRKMVVDLETPRFESGCIFSQDPAISYVWSVKSLNDDQRRAILKILTTKDYALILGMPGTGKTSTMVHAVKALLLRGASILLTSYTNSAVDNLLIKLKAEGIDFIRIGRCEAVHEEVQENCLSVMDMGSTREIKEKLDKINVVAVTCLGITSPLLTKKRFDICIMDEAGQITLPVSLGPLTFASKFVLVGDHYQLPPLVQSPEAKENGMSVSLFCRLSEAHPQAIAALHCQYRMCAAIMELSNALIYGNRLRCGSTQIQNAKLKYKCSAPAPAPAPAPAWLMEVLNPNQPVIFVNTDSLRAYETNDRKAINNSIEAYIIAEITKTLVLRGIDGKDIGIITPYNSQANLIQGAVSEPVEIHTIDKYQGRDKDCILVSFVRSTENPRNCSSSLLGDWHRINVALTRAKKKLIMVGSCKTISKVPLLKLLIEKVEELSGMLQVSETDIRYQLGLKRCSQFI